MLIDCDGCAVRGLACQDCAMTLLLDAGPDAAGDLGRPRGPAGPQAEPVALDRTDRRALRVLAEAGLVPRLRHEPRRRTG